MVGLPNKAVAMLACCLALPLAALGNSIGTQPSVSFSQNTVQAKRLSAAHPLWQDLSPAQQQALAPLAADWDKLNGPRKKKWIELTRHYSTLAPDQQARMQERMHEWAKLSPEERTVARESYSRAKKLEPEQKNAQWERYQQLTDEQKSRLAEEAIARKRVTNLPPAAQDKEKLVPPSKSALRQPQPQAQTLQHVHAPPTSQSVQELPPPLLPSTAK